MTVTFLSCVKNAFFLGFVLFFLNLAFVIWLNPLTVLSSSGFMPVCYSFFRDAYNSTSILLVSIFVGHLLD